MKNKQEIKRNLNIDRDLDVQIKTMEPIANSANLKIPSDFYLNYLTIVKSNVRFTCSSDTIHNITALLHQLYFTFPVKAFILLL